MILAIETSDRLTGISFYENGQIIIEYGYNIPMQHASILGTAVERGQRELALFGNDGQMPTHLAVAIGPGSFTGLRIGLSFAQGYCFGRNIPVAAISSHTVLAHRAAANTSVVYTVIDARRKEVYLSRHHLQDGVYQMDEQHMVRLDTLAERVATASSIILAPGLHLPDAITQVLQKKDCRISGLDFYRASYLASIAEKQIAANKTINAQDLEPMYVRTFAGVL